MIEFVLDRPRHANALDALTIEALLTRLQDPGEARTPMIIRAAGERHFCAGFDLSLVEADPAIAARSLFAVMRGIVERSGPVLCVVDGAARGAGAMLPLVCDGAFAGPCASLAFPEMRLGLPSFAALDLVAWRASRGIAAAMVLFGRTLDAGDALAAGLFDVVSSDGFALEIARASWTAEGGAAFAALKAHRRDALLELLSRAEAATLSWITTGGSEGG